MDKGKQVSFSNHAKIKMVDRGTTEDEIIKAIEEGSSEPARKGCLMFRKNFTFNDNWRGKHFPIKQVAPIVKEEDNKLVVVTVYVYYF